MKGEDEVWEREKLLIMSLTICIKEGGAPYASHYSYSSSKFFSFTVIAPE